MTDIATGAASPAWRSRLGAEPEAARATPDIRRLLQLALAAIWLLDGVLQYQGFMFTKGFSQMLAESAGGNPGIIARPISWAATLVGHHLVVLNSVFAAVQLLLGLGIAWRPAVRPALAASIPWSVAVWWFGEGLGMVLTGDINPVSGAPGAVILYALLAVLLWPADRGGPAPFVAARAVGTRVARALWLVLWLSLAYFALLPASRTPQGLHDMIAGMQAGEPAWVAAVARAGAATVAHQGLAASIILAVVLTVIAVGVCLPPAAMRATVVLALVVAAVFWAFGEAFGGIMAGGATDPGSGPLLALLALSFWPARASVIRAGEGSIAI
jgi:hypothetical protein